MKNSLVVFEYVCILFILVFSACKKETIEPPFSTTPYSFQIPSGFPQPLLHAENPLTVEGVSLGRALYYDPILSNNGLSCSSCHHQNEGFSSAGNGPDGQGILAHVNLAWNPDFGWAGGEKWLDHVCLADLAEGNAFLNANNDSILVRLQRHATYQEMFQKAFNISITEISLPDRQKYIAFAVAQFMRIQVSSQSRFDLYLKHDPASNFTQEEFRGYQIFFTEKGDCFHCHSVPLMTDNHFHNNGLDSLFTGIGLGRYAVTSKNEDRGKFSTPTLRNIALTPPYMHDNRFQTLEEVIEFYNSGVKSSSTVDPLMTKATKINGLQFTAQDKSDLLAFLLTLSDSEFVNNPELSQP